MKRREFFRVLGAGGTGVVAFSCADQEAARKIADGEEAIADADLTWDKAPCRFCGTGCGVEVGVRDGKVMSVRGDEASPCLLYTSPSPRDQRGSRMPSSA